MSAKKERRCAASQIPRTGSGFEIDKDCSRNILVVGNLCIESRGNVQVSPGAEQSGQLRATDFVVVDADALQLQVGGTLVLSSSVDACNVFHVGSA